MFFDSTDELSEILHELKDEFETSGQKKFAVRQLESYDELSFEIIGRYVPKFNRLVKECSGNQAEVLTKRLYGIETSRNRDMFSDDTTESTKYEYNYGIFIVWTGYLPPR